MQLLTTASQGFAHADIDPVSLQPTLGGFELVVGIRLRTVTPDPGYWATLYGAAVHVAGGPGAFVKLGQARPINPIRIRTMPNSLMSTAEFRLPLTAVQVSAIEDLRESGDLQMKLVVAGEGGPISQPERLDPVINELFVQTPRSSWIRELGVAKALDVLLIEIPMPFIDPSPPQRDLMEALRKAQRLLVEGNYSESVARCRTALEVMAALNGRDTRWTGPAFDAAREKRQEMTKDQRELLLEAALLHFTHLGAHPTGVQISRRDAKLALSLTAGVLAYQAD